jgi:hypothetical protein
MGSRPRVKHKRAEYLGNRNDCHQLTLRKITTDNKVLTNLLELPFPYT